MGLLRIAFALSLCACSSWWPVVAIADSGTFAPSEIQPILVRSGDAFYGLAYSGGRACLDLFLPPEPPDHLQEVGCGAIVRFADDGTTSVAHLFVPPEGARPYALRAAGGGALLGVTRAGGAFGRGTAFRFDPASGRYAVLQSLADSGPVANPQNALAGFAAAFADGSVVVEDEPDARFSLLTSGKPGRTLLALGSPARSGPFTVGADERAVFVTARSTDCDVAIVSLGLDGSINRLAPSDPLGASTCKTGALDDLVSVRPATDGTMLANDRDRVYAYRSGRPASIVYDRFSTNAGASPSPAAELFAGSATPANGGDVLVANGLGSCGAVLHLRDNRATSVTPFPGAPCLASFDVYAPALALASLDDGTTYGMLQDATSASDNVFAIRAGKGLSVTSTIADGTPLHDVVLDQSLEFNLSGNGAVSISWSGSGTLGLRDFTIASYAIDVEMKDLDRPQKPSRRLVPASTSPAASQRIDMTMEKQVSASVPFSLATLAPGHYAFVTHALGALTGGAAATPVANDGFTTYLFVPSSGRTASAPDPEVHALVAAFTRKRAVSVAALPIACGSQPNGIRSESDLPIVTIARLHASLQMTGYGPLGLHVVGPGNVRAAYAPFYAVDPILVTFGRLSDDCADASAVFSSAADLQRYLKPA